MHVWLLKIIFTFSVDMTVSIGEMIFISIMWRPIPGRKLLMKIPHHLQEIGMLLVSFINKINY